MSLVKARKRVERLTVNIQRVIDAGRIERAFVATFTTKANLSMDDFQGIWNSFMTDVLVRHLGKVGEDGKKHFHGVGVIEPQERGAPHMHLAGTSGEDIATGVVWVKRRLKGKWMWLVTRQSKPASLARLQAFLMRAWDAHVRAKTRETGEKISNAHCLPVRKSARAAARYLAQYLEDDDSRLGEWKGRRLYREYGSYRKKNESGEMVMVSPHPCRGNFTAYAAETRDGYRVLVGGVLWRGRVKAFAGEFGCTTLDELASHLGTGALFKYRDIIEQMVLAEDFPYPSERSRGREGLRRSEARSGNRAVIEAGGLRVTRYRSVVPVIVFRSTPEEKFYSEVPGPCRVDELFPERVAVISPGEAGLRNGRRRR